MAQLNGSFGSGGMSLALNEAQFSSFIQHLKDEGNQTGLPIKKAACNIGLQPSEHVDTRGRHSGVFHVDQTDTCIISLHLSTNL